MAVTWRQLAGGLLLLISNAALTSSVGTGWVTEFKVTSRGPEQRVGQSIQLDAQSRVVFSCSAENRSRVLHIGKIDPSTGKPKEISVDNDISDGNTDTRFTINSTDPVDYAKPTYRVALANVKEEDAGNYSCYLGSYQTSVSSASILVTVSATPRFLCEKTARIGRRSRFVQCQFYAYNFQSISVVESWTDGQKRQQTQQLTLTDRDYNKTTVNGYTLQLLVPANLTTTGEPYNFTIALSTGQLHDNSSFIVKVKGEKGEDQIQITPDGESPPRPPSGSGEIHKAGILQIAGLLAAVVLATFYRLV